MINVTVCYQSLCLYKARVAACIRKGALCPLEILDLFGQRYSHCFPEQQDIWYRDLGLKARYRRSRHAWMVFCAYKSLDTKKLHIYFNFISFQEIFIERLLPVPVLGTECINRNKTIPLRNDESGSGTRKYHPRYFKQVEV